MQAVEGGRGRSGVISLAAWSPRRGVRASRLLADRASASAPRAQCAGAGGERPPLELAGPAPWPTRHAIAACAPRRVRLRSRAGLARAVVCGGARGKLDHAAPPARWLGGVGTAAGCFRPMLFCAGI